MRRTTLPRRACGVRTHLNASGFVDSGPSYVMSGISEKKDPAELDDAFFCFLDGGIWVWRERAGTKG